MLFPEGSGAIFVTCINVSLSLRSKNPINVLSALREVGTLRFAPFPEKLGRADKSTKENMEGQEKTQLLSLPFHHVSNRN